MLCLGAVMAGVHAAPTPAVQAVERLHLALAQNMAEGAAIGFAGRLARIEPVLAQTFDFDLIAKTILGSEHARMSPAAQARFLDLLQRLSALTYANRFKAASHAERFVTVQEQPARGGRVLVRTLLERDDGPPVSLDYVLQPGADGPRVINVIADGVSDLSLKRAEYAAVIRTNGVDDLLARIGKQVADLARDGAAGG